jgi:uncharacterized protein YjdB
VVSADGNVELEIPAGALDAVTDVVIEPADESLFDGDPLYVVGTGYQLKPAGLQLKERARIRIRFLPNFVPPGVFHEQLRLRERDQTEWRDAQQNQLRVHEMEGQIERFGLVAIWVEPAVGTMVGPQGGVVISADQNVELMIPAGALLAPVDFIIEKADDALFAGDPNYVPGTAYDLKPIGLQFQNQFRARLRIRYDPAHVPPELQHDQLRLRERDRDQDRWRDPSECLLLQNMVQTEIQALGLYAVVGAGPQAKQIGSVTVTGGLMYFEEGDIVQMVAEVRDVDGNIIDVPVTWTSSNTDVAIVDENGLVTAIAEGSATITAAVGGVQGGKPINVGKKGTRPASVAVLPATASISVGGTVQLTAEVRDAAGNLMTASVTWKSSSTAIATVNAGLVTGVSAGAVLITASVQNVSGSASVTVVGGPSAGSLVITEPGNEPLEIGLTRQLVATVYDANGQPIPAAVVWSSSDNAIATVIPTTGLVTGVSAGTVTITATYGALSDAVSIRVVGESEEEAGNNLSVPLVFAEGIGLTGLPVATETGLRPLASEGIVVDALPFFWSGNAPTYGVYFEQQTFNVWQAEWVNGAGQPAYDAEIYWGDNLTVREWSATRPIRIEQSLYATGLSLAGFNMFSLYGSGENEMFGTDGSTAAFTPSIYTKDPQLIVEKLSGPGGQVVATVLSSTAGSEINVAGKVIYGYLLRLADWTPPSGVTRDGWYRLTFKLAATANVNITSVGNTEGTYLPIVFNSKESRLEILVTN